MKGKTRTQDSVIFVIKFGGRAILFEGTQYLSNWSKGAVFKKVYCVSPWNIESQDFQLMLILKF